LLAKIRLCIAEKIRTEKIHPACGDVHTLYAGSQSALAFFYLKRESIGVVFSVLEHPETFTQMYVTVFLMRVFAVLIDITYT
jgi:hypothetical protein